jgi:hypothetical protein
LDTCSEPIRERFLGEVRRTTGEVKVGNIFMNKSFVYR